MSKAAIGWICLLLAVFVPVIDGSLIGLKSGVSGGVNGGVDCATCSIILGLVDHLTIVYKFFYFSSSTCFESSSTISTDL